MATSALSTMIQRLRACALMRDDAGFSDADLLELFLNSGDEAAITALIRRHGPMIWSVCRRILRNHQDAEDAFQATYLILIRKAASIVRRETLPSWLHSVAYQTAMKARALANKRQAREKQVADLPEPIMPDKDPTWREVQGVIDTEINGLPAKYRAVIVLCELEGKTRKAAARLLGVPEGTVAGRLARARALLAKRLTKRGIALSGGSLAALLSQQASTAAVPSAVTAATVKAATAAGVISAEVAALVKGVMTVMLLNKLKVVTALVVLAGALAFGGGVITQQMATAQVEQSAVEKQKAAPAEIARPMDGDSKHQRADSYGDPLPDGAVARLGTTRFRHGHHAYVIAHAPNGKLVATAGRAPGICIFDADTGRLLHSLPEFRLAIAFSPDSKKLFTGVELIDVPNGRKLRRVEAPNRNAGASAAFSPDGRIIASGGYGNRAPVVLWDTETGNNVRVMNGHEADVDSIAFSPIDNNILASGSQDKTVRVWNLKAGKERHRLDHEKSVLRIAFAPDGKTLASIDQVGIIRIWDIVHGKLLHEMKSEHGQWGSIAFSTDGKLLASTGSDSSICLWHSDTGRKHHQWRTILADNSSLAFAPNGKTLISTSYGTVLRWDVATGKELRSDSGHQSAVLALQFAPGGKSLVSIGRDKMAKEWTLAVGQPTKRLFQMPLGPARPEHWFPVDLTADRKLIAQSAINVSSVVRVWDVVSGKEICSLNGTEKASAVKFSWSGKEIAVSTPGGIGLWEVASGKHVRNFPPKVDTGPIAFSPDDRLIVSGCNDGKFRMWEVSSGKEVRNWKFSQRFPTRFPVVFSHDGRWIAGADDNTIRVWTVESGKELMQVAIQMLPFTLGFSPTGRILAAGGFATHAVEDSAAEQSDLRLWDVETGREIRQIKSQQGITYSLAFTRNGRTLASGGADSTILLWDMTVSCFMEMVSKFIPMAWANAIGTKRICPVLASVAA